VTSQVIKNISSVDNLQGFDALEDADADAVEEAFDLGYVPEHKEIEDKVWVWTSAVLSCDGCCAGWCWAQRGWRWAQRWVALAWVLCCCSARVPVWPQCWA
jgi:hypothetical protein